MAEPLSENGTETNPAFQVAAILPLRLEPGERGADTFERAWTLLGSLEAAGVFPILRPFQIVVPRAGLREADRLAAGFPGASFTVLDEGKVCPHFRRPFLRRGYYRQQILKLVLAARSVTEFSLTLDADLYCTGNFTMADLVAEGRALMQFTKRTDHPRWWEASARILDTASDRELRGMSVTPAILSRDVARHVLNEIERVNGRDPVDVLLKRTAEGWTEYTLYHLAAEKLGLLDQYHVPAGEEGRPRLICRSSLWHEERYATWDPRPCFEGAPRSLFVVCQSTTRIDPALLRSRLQSFGSVTPI